MVGNWDDLLVEDTKDSISSVLKKEIEGKVSFFKPNTYTSSLKAKNLSEILLKMLKMSFFSFFTWNSSQKLNPVAQ